jgi:hypothetical protein
MEYIVTVLDHTNKKNLKLIHKEEFKKKEDAYLLFCAHVSLYATKTFNNIYPVSVIMRDMLQKKTIASFRIKQLKFIIFFLITF